jgi:predicted signal transduction protein with EAL and GGDEF domain
MHAELLAAFGPAAGGHDVEVAVGVASFPEHASTPEELRHGADQAVTAARKLGPSRVVAFSPGVETSVGV